MDIRQWGIGRIMQLPECCFGRKFVVSCEVKGYGDGVFFDISEMAFPELMVIWQVSFEPYYMNDLNSYVRVALGDTLPTTEAQFMLLEPLLNGYGYQGPGPRVITFYTNFGQTILLVKMPVAAAGRNLCLMSSSASEKHAKCRVAVVVSSVPKEVPDWLVSGQGKNQL